MGNGGNLAVTLLKVLEEQALSAWVLDGSENELPRAPYLGRLYEVLYYRRLRKGGTTIGRQPTSWICHSSPVRRVTPRWS